MRHGAGTWGVVVGFAGLTTVLVAVPLLGAWPPTHAPVPVGQHPYASFDTARTLPDLVPTLYPYAMLFVVLVFAYAAILARLERGPASGSVPVARPPAPRPRRDEHLRFRPSYKAAAGRRAEVRYERSRVLGDRDAEAARRGLDALSTMLGETGRPHILGATVPTAVGGLYCNVIALVGSTIVVMAVLHLKGTITAAGLGERWEHEPRQGDQEMLPNPVSHLIRVSAAVSGVVGEAIAVRRLVVLTGPAKAVSCGRETVTLAGLGARLDGISKEDGGVSVAVARNRFGYLARAVGG